jgi:two-component system cell cycle sensor histidine kinase/response regulator CckA
MLRTAMDYIEENAAETNFALDVEDLRAQLEQRALRQLSRSLSVESIFEDLEIARQSSRAILNIKEDLIGPAREKHLEAVDLASLLKTIVKSMGIPEGVARYLFSENMAPAKADIRQLENVFNNLLKNAMEAMYKVEDKKLFIWGRRADDARFVVVDITDNGEGIPPDIIDKIWVPFYTTKGNRGGTGLGLPACNKIITQLGGKIVLDSMVGEGTTFSVYLPVYKA